MSESLTFNKKARKLYECIIRFSEKARHAPISGSTRRTTYPLELIQLEIFVNIEESLHKYRYTVLFSINYTLNLMSCRPVADRSFLIVRRFEIRAKKTN